MESNQLFLFLNQLSVWPQSSNEKDSVAEKIAQFLDVPLVVFFSSRHGEAVGLKVFPTLGSNHFNKENFVNVLKTQLNQLIMEPNQLNKLQLGQSGLRILIPSVIQNLTYSRFFQQDSRGSKDLMSFIVGSKEFLSSKEELCFVAIGQKLLDLIKISELQADLQNRNQFLSIASHELKTPLTSIYGILQLQERMLRGKRENVGFEEQTRHHTFLKMVIRQVERLNELIDGLLDVSRIQNGRFMVDPSDTDVVHLLNEMIQARLNVIAKEAGVKLHVDSVAQLVAWVDPVRMEEVISNLVMNAIRFSPEGGVVWIRLFPNEDSFRLTVRDQGPSIPLEDRERIFRPFERALRTGRLGGLGLGLFISREIAQLHGGNVSLIESVPGKGNVFEAYFPLRSYIKAESQPS